ncbi:DUF1256 domain-containing protein [Geobacillus stearothermophilus]|uniref:Uncharacterized protein n=1 Tax=Geobacillus stearothermophilus TaxID=1422 RepID=A0ABQ7HII1_GEOSE|nr:MULTISPECIES: DUF1256 domain-containing protein [Geobacillus]KAF6511969.1 hypothetical protein GS8_268 [Geobacillus stearothermophilus]MED3719397.1 DUF1256 domain-containing protein [Geobacillus stearothermophilus]MED3724348.1 DUF1256 domain-containing protein [Geobacillus stearothermophilus]MED3730143.1 DUF1256 domain-containing protein [Geobacillus stearothermophilus]MED3734558.1 DUF1256 domain-containing protein [Geobacillus stearothermophilus]
MKSILYSDPLAPLLIRNELFSLLPAHISRLTVVCIGSNRINGDSLGSFVGTLLENAYPDHLTVIGNLESLSMQRTSVVFPSGCNTSAERMWW